MCGIVGLMDLLGRPVAKTALEKAANSLYKRGPDSEGVWLEGNVGVAHRRLSILDLSPAGHQPMLSRTGRYVCVYNGEVYNFSEIRMQLDPYPSAWLSNSDTEVIIAAYEKWGPECLGHFRGMFAFAIWDRQERVFFAARDRMGVKPFYYHVSDRSFAFASRPRAIYNLLPELSDELDWQALRYYLETGYIPSPYSIFRRVRKLPPAHYLIVRDGQAEITCYWHFRDLPISQEWRNRAEEDLLEELDAILTESVKLRMISDVPLGAFLSGGIDSSLVVAKMAKLSSQPVNTFTIGFGDVGFDESPFALAVASHLKTSHYVEHLEVDDLLKLLPAFTAEFDEPFFDSSSFPVMAVSRLARGHVTVSLSGDGGDELFGGYHYYGIAEKIAAVMNLPLFFREPLCRLIGLLPQHKVKLLSAALHQDDRISAYAFLRGIAKDFDSVLLPEVAERTEGIQCLFQRSAQSFPSGLRPSEEGMRLDASFILPEDYLQKVDVGSMAFSLESREPLLDHKLVEWAMRLPREWKLRNGQNKYLLRKLAYRHVPREILDRPKKGFEVPIGRWLRGPLKDWALEMCNNKALFEQVPISQDKVRALLHLHFSGERNAHPVIWAVLMLLNFAGNFRTCRQ